MNILITGGSGFIAGHFIRRLSADGHQVTILDLVTPPQSRAHLRFVHGDVRDPVAMNRALEGNEFVLHLAAAHHDYGITRETSFTVNVGGAQVLCDAMDAHGITHACFFSSAAVYGDAPEPRVESGPALPVGAYGESKLEAEQVFKRWAERAADRRALVIRPTVVFGRENYANMFSLIRYTAMGLYVPFGRGENVKSLAQVDTIVAATMMLWSRADAPAFDVFNVVDKPDLTSREIADTILRALGRSPLPFHVPLSVGKLLASPFDALASVLGRNLPISSARIEKLFNSRTCFNADKLASTGFRAPRSLKEGLTDMVHWYQAEGRRNTPVAHIPPAAIGGDVITSSRASSG